ncbi:MAG: DUF5009 domain-containing protein [Saprospiraceae bacterium]|nr:DUF5009 domain-containing protein [Saprospiraceae bacterium]
MEQSKRLLSLDVFRGITIAGMILVNTPGTWTYVYPPLQHAQWHGNTPTDWVFPLFLFIMGVSVPLALGKRVQEGVNRRQLMFKILKRTLIIFGLGLFLYGFPYFDLAHQRIPGVLQRIALVYFFCSLIFVYTKGWRSQFWIAIGLLILYWFLMTFVPVPWSDGTVPANLDMLKNLGTWLDKVILSENHMYHGEVVNGTPVAFDPEGILSTLPSIATGLSGVLTGIWLKTERTDYEKLTGMFAIGTILIALGLIWNPIFPINKKLWTSSYVLYMAGIALVFLGVVYWVVDVFGYKRWTKPFVVFGTNALFAYFMSELVAITMFSIPVNEKQSLFNWVYASIFEPLFASPYNASLIFAIVFVIFILGLTWILYWRKIFIRA